MSLIVRRSPRATAEILGIVARLAEYSPAAARRFLDALRHAQEQLAAHPYSGAPGLLPGTRRLILGDYIISYRVRRDMVEVYAVRHGKRGDARP